MRSGHDIVMTTNQLAIPDSVKQLKLYKILINTPELIKKNLEINDYCQEKNLECTYYDMIEAIKNVFNAEEYQKLKEMIRKYPEIEDGERNALLIDLNLQSSGKKSRKRKHNKLKKKKKSTRKKRRKLNKKHR
jgi:hypothetical protein